MDDRTEDRRQRIDKSEPSVCLNCLNRLNCLLSVVCCLFIGCAAPPKIEEKTIFVFLFYNETKEYGLSEVLNLAITDEIMKDGHLKIEDREKVDLSLSGRIVDYKKTPVAWTEKKEIIEYRLRMDIEFELFFQNNLILKKRLSEAIIYSEDEEKEKLRLCVRVGRRISNELRRFIKGYK
ncbi:MAG: LptE family protein [bacterium]